MQKDIYGTADRKTPDTPLLPCSAYIPHHTIVTDEQNRNDTSAKSAKWLYGKLYECVTKDTACKINKISFGKTAICSWPLKEHEDRLDKHPPPCLG